MEEKINVLSEALIKYAMLHTENERAKAWEKIHIPYLDISVTDKENHVHAVSFYKKDLRYSSAQHDDVYNYYFKCESPLLGVNMECWHPEIDWERYNITSNYDEDLLSDVLDLAVQYINNTDGLDYIKMVCDNTNAYLCGKNNEICVVPEGTEVIGRHPFLVNLFSPEQLRGVEKVILPESLKIILGGAFCNCRSLRKIIIPKSVKTIGENTFYRCQNLTIYCRAAEKPSGWVEELRSVCFTKNYAEHIKYYWASWIGEAVAWVENSNGEVTTGHRDAPPPGIQTKSSTIAVGVENIVWGYTGA